jgi:hypothetical protein
VAIVAVPGVGGTIAVEEAPGAVAVVVGASGPEAVAGAAGVVAAAWLATAEGLAAGVVDAEVLVPPPQAARPVMQIPATAIVRIFMK